MNRLFVFVAAACGACLFVQASAAEVYKWVDKEGGVHFGDRPPDGAGAHEVNTASLPLALQERLRSLDPYFTITHFGGNVEVGYVCGEFNPDSGEPRFPTQVESTRLGTIRVDSAAANAGMTTVVVPHYTRRGTTTTLAAVPGKCAWSAQRDPNTQRRAYEIRFNPDAVRTYHGDGR